MTTIFLIILWALTALTGPWAQAQPSSPKGPTGSSGQAQAQPSSPKGPTGSSGQTQAQPPVPKETVKPGAPASTLSAEEAFRLRRSGVFLTVEGKVASVLKDDRKGVPHQRFILRLASGLTLLVTHNTAVAPRVPVQPGDLLRVRGEYRWNKKGGVLHFTHRPTGRSRSRPGPGLGGWIRTQDGKVFR